ncbi:MAG TPA: PH domain-containing protein [Mycobacteriales bacterium]|jgi:hypothetical protein|nr:PH domain-containing protein [Mycobacteriales bacterium]
MTAQPLPLAKRPRRSTVQRPPSLADAERALRRTAAPTTTTRLRLGALGEGAVARAGVPVAEAVTSLLLVTVCFVPALVWSRAAPGMLIALAISLLATGYAIWARRLVVGEEFVAVRSVLRYRVAYVDHVRHLRLRPTQRGGQLCLHTDDGHCLRLRRVELDVPAVRDALRRLAGCGSSTRDPYTCDLLALEPDPARTLAQYRPAPAGA